MIGYTPQFQHKDWIDGVDTVQAGGSNGFNGRFHALESEFALIASAIASAETEITNAENTPPAVGMTVVVGISNGASIPVPTGFQASETKFFAFVKTYSVDLATAGTDIGFSVFSSDTGQVTVVTDAPSTGGVASAQSIYATGVAIAKRGGW
jgi:hypothetical protein